ncbi:hypothetical protein LGN22_26740 [Burkholderia cenocepacia]|uniref:Uncharacterized protein n=1 Tax=Burkholderia cenocepacia TaxID=95486 RepID=A0AAW4TRT0_9BURK|nr:hypothetical protein [Burkholderia cenocepacia]MCA8382507.1 hypothetical protein [Burkholderia cenocepacia]
MKIETSGTTLPRSASNTFNRDEEFKRAVFEGRLIVYVDEWRNKRTLEARVYGLTRGGRQVVVGFQLDADRGVAPEKLWKTLDDLDRIWILDEHYAAVRRILPSQQTATFLRIDALSENTEIDASVPTADGY